MLAISTVRLQLRINRETVRAHGNLDLETSFLHLLVLLSTNWLSLGSNLISESRSEELEYSREDRGLHNRTCGELSFSICVVGRPCQIRFSRRRIVPGGYSTIHRGTEE